MTSDQKTSEVINPHGHRWFVCEMCGPSVICGKCGNNACNGGYGMLPDGSKCDACPSAYEMQEQGDGLVTSQWQRSRR